ncbi:MAG: dUTP diphosphatase [Caldisericia bacterium]|jgi:dUTP pyrophosphatase|nr:dUTP diphosphatase [Caldisericia bacterium]MDD5688790.1 dUTP diphosphatase [Caldisericia bacterium]HOJ16003.1 dUTP diphosphatase [Caldisericia bacterium]HOW03184.1 dUTP diphosphatase [Caldisericia bacterium]HQF37258.1 dUTP diphosphatase [Candidatus Dojkabacteria bacterium]
MSKKIRINTLNSNFVLPKYAHEGDAGLDLYSTDDVILLPRERKKVGCGFSIAIPEGFLGAIAPRSGLAIEYGVTVLNSWGVIDPSYRGEVSVILINLSNNDVVLKKGSKIAQLIIVPYEKVELFIDSEKLDSTDRGEKGFGSSGIYKE